MKHIYYLVLVLSVNFIFAQNKPDTSVIEEDYSQYEMAGDAATNVNTKVYCSQKVIGLSPSKLISLGFDFVGANALTADTLSQYLGKTSNIANNSGLRFLANFPVISNNKMILNFGVNYLDFKYKLDSPVEKSNPLTATLAENGLRSYGINGTLFKPFNSTRFMILQLAFDYNSADKINAAFDVKAIKTSAVAIYGVKPHERLQWGLGLSRTYRGGGVNYIPVYLYNYTFPNKKWGIEMLLPAKANVRYTLNSRNLLFAGFELEGAAYSFNLDKAKYNLNFKRLQLERSEIRPRITYEFSLYKFIWMSVQAGYRLNYKFGVDDRDDVRLITDRPYILDNDLKNAYYFNISLNLVSP
jgi:Domain of unknown function (DUF6268)